MTQEGEMSDSEIENGEESIDETGRNPTQRRMDEEGTDDDLVTIEPDEQEDEPWAT